MRTNNRTKFQFLFVMGFFIFASTLLNFAYSLAIGSLSNEINKLTTGRSLELKLKQTPNQIQPTEVTYQREKMQEIVTPNGTFTAYRLADEWSHSSYGAYAIVYEPSFMTYYLKYVAFATANPMYGTGEPLGSKVIALVGDKLWVINSQTRSIDEYLYKEETSDGKVVYSAYFSYNRSIKLPKLNLGQLYFMECDDSVCHLQTAHHLESGCDLDINIKTEEFSNIECSNMAGSFKPEAY
jgi:hypothetical protein